MEKLKPTVKGIESRKKCQQNNESCTLPFHSDDSSVSSALSKSPHPVLKNDVILKEIFSFLKPEDYMQCRLVCRKWKSAGEAHFKSTVQVCFNFDAHHLSFDLREFFENAQKEFPFRLVKFEGPLPLSTSNLSSFFSAEGKFITHLTLNNITLANEDLSTNPTRSYLPECNIMDILSRIENLKSLVIACFKTWTRLKLPLVSLRDIEYINLADCTIELSPTTIAPIELLLKRVNFSRENLSVKDVRLNDFVEFGVLEKLVIINSRFRDSRDLTLDLVGNVTLNHLELNNIRIGSLENTSWNAKSLDLCCGEYTQNSFQNIEKLRLRFSKCDLLCLPPTVNALSIGSGTTFVGTELRNIIFPNIKHLELNDKIAIENYFPFLATSFFSVRELKLEDTSMGACIIDINQIPKSVETLIFSTSNFEFVGHGIFSLNSLTIEDDFEENLQFIVHVTKHFFPKLLKAEINIDTPYKPCNRLIHLKSLLNTSIPKIMLGELRKHHVAYLKSCPSFESTSPRTGQIVNSYGNKITFSFLEIYLEKQFPITKTRTVNIF